MTFSNVASHSAMKSTKPLFLCWFLKHPRTKTKKHQMCSTFDLFHHFCIGKCEKNTSNIIFFSFNQVGAVWSFAFLIIIFYVDGTANSLFEIVFSPELPFVSFGHLRVTQRSMYVLEESAKVTFWISLERTLFCQPHLDS